MKTKTKSRRSKVELLPKEIRDQLNMMLRSGEMHQTEIVHAINELIDSKGLSPEHKLSKSGFNYYAQRMEKMGAKIKQARQVAEVWTTRLGDAPISDVGKMLQEFVRTMAFETSMHMMDESDKGTAIPPKALGQLALVVQRIEQAAMTSQKVEKEIRAAFAAEAANAAEEIVINAGITAKTAADIKKQILGIK